MKATDGYRDKEKRLAYLREYGKKYKVAHREKFRADTRRYYQEHKKEKLAYCTRWKKAHPEKVKTYQARGKPKELKRRKQLRRETKTEVFAAYGNKCQCCGETRKEFLSIDHIFGGGRKHHRELSNQGRTIYQEVKRLGFPKDKFRLLCFNCNLARGFYGYCPHEREEQELEQIY